jgi:hypothetical protein
MIEKIALKVNAMLSRKKFLPVCEQISHGCLQREIENPVEMIWHEQHESGVPEFALFVRLDGVEDDFRCMSNGQCVFAMITATDRDEIRSIGFRPSGIV